MELDLSRFNHDSNIHFKDEGGLSIPLALNSILIPLPFSDFNLQFNSDSDSTLWFPVNEVAVDL